MPKLTIIIGVSCSGKSTWAEKQKDAKIVSYDDFRTWYYGRYHFGDSKKEVMLRDIADAATISLLENDIDVILDNTHLTDKIISKTIEKYNPYADIYLHTIEPPDIEVLYERNKKRHEETGKLIPEKVIEKQYSQFKLLSIEKTFYPKTQNVKKIKSDITEYAQLQFIASDIETILEIDDNSLQNQVKRKKGNFYHAYRKGQLIAEATLRKSIYDLAKSGSTPAQKEFIKLIEKRQQSEQRKKI